MPKSAELLHDLKMPLQLIYSCAQLLEGELRENDRARGYVEMLQSSALQLQRMLTGALEQLRPDGMNVRFARADLVHLTWETYARCQIYAARKEIELSFHSNADRLEMALDEEKVVRILMNLVSNALKFTPAGGSVRMVVRAMGDFAEVSVADDGCGISAERMPTIFELHETDGGYGYGLYISRRYARMMGGELRAESAAGAGSVFTLRLPVCSVEAAKVLTQVSAVPVES